MTTGRLRGARALLALLAGAALAAAACPAAATAAGMATARWNATIELRQSIRWEVPKFYTHSNCFDRFWAQGRGEETWTVRTQRPTRVLAYRIGAGGPVYFRYGTWDELGGVGQRGMKARSRTVRNGLMEKGADPGRCGGNEPRPEPPRERDCGARLSWYDFMLQPARGGRLRIQPISVEGEPNYRNCPVSYPLRLRELHHIPGRVSAGALLGGRGVTVSGSASYDEDRRFTSNGRLLVGGTTTWTVKLQPAGR